MELNTTEFFKYFILHPDSQLLNEEDRLTALIGSIALGILTLGICHMVCAIAFTGYKPVAPGTTTPSTEIFDKRVRPSSIQQEIVPKVPELDEIKKFWITYFDPKNGELQRILQMLHEKYKEAETFDFTKIATELVNHYYGTTRNDEIVVAKLIADIAYNLESWLPQPVVDLGKTAIPEARIPPRGILQLSDGNYLGRCPTNGDGSCGFYALMGEPINGEYRLNNIQAVRTEFCEFLRTRRASGTLPNEIKNVIDDYFLYFSLAPSAFQRATRDIRAELYQEYEHSPIQRQEEIKQEFLDNDAVFEAYLNHISDQHAYLLQDELIAVAIWKNLTIRLSQPAWGSERALVRYDLLNEGDGRDIVDIYYNGHNHYERALFIPTFRLDDNLV